MTFNSELTNSQTIVAQATPAGRSGVAVIRVSGKQVQEIALKILKKVPLPRTATLLPFYGDNEIIDTGIAIYYPAPRSFTGEDVLEFQGHGGHFVVELLIQRIQSLGVRLARPGEFSERAFLNDKMDLLQVEAVADLIDSHSRAAARAAMRTLQGDFSKDITNIMDEISEIRMYVEASIDFSEEEIDLLSEGKITERYQRVLKRITFIIQKAEEGCRLRDGLKVVMAGPPNVGKSTLMNILSGMPVAIVTSIPGTTRDILREQVAIGGLYLSISDTAGIHETVDEVEKEGIRRTQEEIKSADHLLWLVECGKTKEQILALEEVLKILDNPPKVTIVRNKCDVVNEAPGIIYTERYPIITLSAKSEMGISILKEYMESKIVHQVNTESVFMARSRHIEALQRSKAILEQGLEQIEKRFFSIELIAEDLKEAQNCLGEITGSFTTEDLLGKIFANFCIGK